LMPELGLRVTTDFREVEQHLDPNFFKSIGSLESSNLRNAETIAYAYQPALLKLKPTDAILYIAAHVSQLLYGLWLVKDHSAYPGEGFMQISDGKDLEIHSNRLEADVTTAVGERSTIAVTRQDLQGAAKFLDKLMGAHNYNFRLGPGTQAAVLGSQREAKRISRAIYFTSIARRVNDLGVKIVNYCTALETLFSTDSVELAHKVSQRAAVFMGGSSDEKMATYDLIKRSYGMRSKVVHGDGLANATTASLRSTLQELDALLRSVLVRILSSEEVAQLFDQGRDELERHFTRTSFS